MRHTLSYPDLKAQKPSDAHRNSLDNLHLKHFEETTEQFMMRIQRQMLKEYKNQLKTIRHCNDFDPNVLTDVIIHDSENKEAFRNAVLFMKNRLDMIMSAL